jgi:hypothetical protein
MSPTIEHARELPAEERLAFVAQVRRENEDLGTEAES